MNGDKIKPKNPQSLRTLILLMENKTGVLNRISSLCRRRRFNIESLSVGHTETEGISRMTIVVDADETNVEQMVKQMSKLINILKVQDVTDENIVLLDLAIVKVATDKDSRMEIQQLAEMFQAKVIDITLDSFIIQLVGKPEKIDAFLDVVKSFKVKEMVRTGATAMHRGAEFRLEI